MSGQVDFLSAVSADVFAPLARYSSVVVLCDENTRRDCYPLVAPHLPAHHLVEIASGEEHKTLRTCEYIWMRMTELKLDRSALLLNLGGGVIGDMGGFCAATYKRGIAFWQMPTTLLSQVDASVGGKLGVDFGVLKNHIGVFQLPGRVLIYPGFLATLPARELRSGYAEVLKHALIADAAEWERLSAARLEDMDWQSVIRHSVDIKQTVVAEDPEEKGLRKILNFGHTIGHAIESHLLTDPERKLLHGEAIAVGMICEAYLSYTQDMLSLQQLEDITASIRRVYGGIVLTQEDFPSLFELMLHDKKNKGLSINFSLLKGIGACAYDVRQDWTEIQKSLAYYMAL